jgi:hypothetical protein
VFDIASESCLDDAMMERWLQSWDPYTKSVVPRQWAIEYFARRGFQLDGTFKITMMPGITEYLVFTRAEDRQSL